MLRTEHRAISAGRIEKGIGEIYEFMGLKIPSSNVKYVVNDRKMSQICVSECK